MLGERYEVHSVFFLFTFCPPFISWMKKWDIYAVFQRFPVFFWNPQNLVLWSIFIHHDLLCLLFLKLKFLSIFLFPRYGVVKNESGKEFHKPNITNMQNWILKVILPLSLLLSTNAINTDNCNTDNNIGINICTNVNVNNGYYFYHY